MTIRVISLSCRPAETVHLWWHEGLAGVRAELSMRLIQEMQRQADDVPLPNRMA